MSGFHNPATRPVARKQHRCIACYHGIPAGEQHVHQTGVWEGRWYRNRYHVECFDALVEDGGDFEFTPGDGEPPERLSAPAERR